MNINPTISITYNDNILPEILFQSICKKNELVLTNLQMLLLKNYVKNLLEWNQKINLISRKDTENVWIQHILSSVSFLFKFDIKPHSTMIDLGTGGGLPGIPVSIIRPDLRLVLIDSTQKKIMAVKNILEILELNKVSVFCGRAEELSKKKDLHNKFDYVIARSVSATKDIIRWGKPFLNINQLHEKSCNNIIKNKIVPAGSIILLKGGDLSSEIEEAKIKSNPEEIRVYPLVFNGIESTQLFDKKIVIIKP